MKSIDSNIKLFLDMNNQGISCLTEGQPLVAMDYFLKAAVELQHALHIQEGQEAEICEPTAQSDGVKNSRKKKKDVGLMNNCDQMQDELFTHQCLLISIPNFGDGQFYIFNKAIVFPFHAPSKECPLLLEKNDIVFLCGTVMFNLALSYHWIGHTLGMRMATCEAVYFYETALNLLRLGSSSAMVSHMTRIKLAVAVWNNISQIRHHEKDFYNSRKTFANVQTLLASQRIPIFDQEIYKELSLNAFVLLNLANYAPSAPCA